MRIILYTGKGGVGKTSVAAATAARCAAQGLKTLVVSTDPAHSLADSLDEDLGGEPRQISENLWAQEIDAIHEIESGWGRVQQYLTELFTAKAVKDITTQELTVFPGMEDLLSLLRILKYYREGYYDLIVIDCAPTGETLALLSFPEMFRWWMEKLFPMKKKVVAVMGPVIEPLLGIPMPSSQVMSEIDRLYENLDAMKQLFSDKTVTSIRIVVNPEKMVIREAQRSFTYLNIYDFNVDAVVVNRVLPETVTDQYFQGWKDIQKRYGQDIRDSFSPLPILEAPLFETEVVGLPMLERMGEAVFGRQAPEAILYAGEPHRIDKVTEGYELVIEMPFVEKENLSLNQKGDELIIRAGSVKRNITLPRTLLNFALRGARFEGGRLRIRFIPDGERGE